MTTRAGLYGPEAIQQTDGRPAGLTAVQVFDSDGVTPSVIYTDQMRTGTLAQPVLTDALGNLAFYAEAGIHKLLIRGELLTVQVPVNPSDDLSIFPVPFSVPGVVATGAGSARFYLPENYVAAGPVLVGAGVAPTGQPLIVDLNYNGVSVYTDQSQRPKILAGTNSGSGGTATTTTYPAGGYFTLDRDQVGSAVAGSDLVVIVPLQRTG